MGPSIIITGNDPATLPVFQPQEQPICGICKTQFSRYTCPHCNLHYCTLTCFRSNEHSNCSEKFDRISLLDEIHSNKDKTAEEKKGMLELLKRFEEEAANAEAGGEGEEEDGEEEDEEGDEERRLLEEKLNGVDLDKLTSDELLDLLSPAQRDQFDITLRDPTKASKLIDEEFEGDLPWWEIVAASELKEEKIEELGEEEDEEHSNARPNLIDVKFLPGLKVGEDGKALVSPLLVYNIVAVLFAYSYTLRTFSLTSFSSLDPGSTERNTAIQVFSQLLPFLFEKSTLVFDNVASSIEYVISRETPDSLNPELLALLLKDVSTILSPASITTLSSDTTTSSTLSSHPLLQSIAALSDLNNLLSSSNPILPKSIIKRPSSIQPLPTNLNQAKQKNLFYLTFLSHDKTPLSIDELRNISERVGGEGEKREREGKETKDRIKSMKIKMEEGKKKLEEKKLISVIEESNGKIVGAKIQEI